MSVDAVEAWARQRLERESGRPFQSQGCLPSMAGKIRVTVLGYPLVEGRWGCLAIVTQQSRSAPLGIAASRTIGRSPSP